MSLLIKGGGVTKLSSLDIDAILNMAGYRIENVGAPDSDDDAPRRDTIDSKITTHGALATVHQNAPALISTHAALVEAHHDPVTIMDIREDFITGRIGTGQLGTMGWMYSGGQSPTVLASYGNHPGIIRFATNAALNNRCVVFHLGTTEKILLHTALFELTFIFKLVSIANVRVFFGAIDSIANAPGNRDRAGFEFDTTGDTYWMKCCGDGSASTRTATDIAVAQESMYKLKIARTGSGFDFYVNGVNKGTVTGNLPNTGLVYGFSIETLTTSARLVDMDFARIYLPGISR